MRERTSRITLGLLAVLVASGCSWIGVGGGGESAEQRRARCDQLAAQAIEAESVDDARRLAARATECYAAEVQRGDDG